MAGMPKQGYKNLVLAGWVLDPALGWRRGGHTDGGSALPVGGPGVGWGLLAGGPGDTPLATAEVEGEREGKKKKKAGGKEKHVSPSTAILSGLNFTLLLKI